MNLVHAWMATRGGCSSTVRGVVGSVSHEGAISVSRRAVYDGYVYLHRSICNDWVFHSRSSDEP